MKQEIRIFFTALMFYTRIPCPKWVDHSEEYINKSIRYFPLVGWIVGGLAGLVFIGSSTLVNPFFAIVAYLTAGVLITGAFHEDGFADVCDGFGGGWTVEKILSIMKDSRVGAYGVVGLIFLFGAKASLLFEIQSFVSTLSIFLFIITIQALSRYIAATFVFTHQYVRETDSKIKPVVKSTGLKEKVLSAFFGLLPLLLTAFYLNNYFLLLLAPGMYLSKILLARYFKKWIGGYTGDCLGATQQVVEVVGYLLIILIWRFI